MISTPSFAVSKNKWTTDKCKMVFNYVKKPYLKLYKHLLIEKRKKIHPRYKKLLKSNKNLCNDPKSRKDLRLFLEEILAMRNNHVGLMSQLGGDTNTPAHNVYSSMSSYFQNNNPKVKFNVLDTGYDFSSFLRQLALAVLVLDVNYIVLGPGKYSIHQAKKILHQLRLPTFVLSNDNGGFQSKFSFQVFPNLDQMTKTLLIELELQKKYRLSLVSSRLSSIFMQSLKNNLKYFPKLSVVSEHEFNPDEYQSMDKTVRSLLKLNPEDQPIEYKKLALLESNNTKAKTFDAAFQLEAIKEFDVVVFPGNFKNLKHFTRTLKYFRSGPVQIVGSQKWRSKELVNPLPKILENSYFVDYVGYYNMLPKNISDYQLDQKDHSFVGASDVSNIDFKLIGTRAAEIISQATNLQSSSRTIKVGLIHKMSHSKSNFFKAGRVFSENRKSNWPAFMFKLTDKKLNLFRIR